MGRSVEQNGRHDVLGISLPLDIAVQVLLVLLLEVRKYVATLFKFALQIFPVQLLDPICVQRIKMTTAFNESDLKVIAKSSMFSCVGTFAISCDS